MSWWKLTDLADSEIAGLEAGGIPYTPADVLAIQRLSLEATGEIEDGMDLSRGRPVEVGKVVLWPLTIAGLMFYVEVEPTVTLPELKLFVLAYAMANGDDVEKMDMRGSKARAAVWKWGCRLGCTFVALSDAVDRVLADPVFVQDPNDDEDRDVSIAKLAAFAVTYCGGDPKMWEYQCSLKYVARIVEQAQLLDSLKNGVKHDAPRLKGLRRLGLFIEQIKNRGKQNG